MLLRTTQWEKLSLKEERLELWRATNIPRCVVVLVFVMFCFALSLRAYLSVKNAQSNQGTPLSILSYLEWLLETVACL